MLDVCVTSQHGPRPEKPFMSFSASQSSSQSQLRTNRLNNQGKVSKNFQWPLTLKIYGRFYDRVNTKEKVLNNRKSVKLYRNAKFNFFLVLKVLEGSQADLRVRKSGNELFGIAQEYNEFSDISDHAGKISVAENGYRGLQESFNYPLLVYDESSGGSYPFASQLQKDLSKQLALRYNSLGNHIIVVMPYHGQTSLNTILKRFNVGSLNHKYPDLAFQLFFAHSVLDHSSIVKLKHGDMKQDNYACRKVKRTFPFHNVRMRISVVMSAENSIESNLSDLVYEFSIKTENFITVIDYDSLTPLRPSAVRLRGGGYVNYNSYKNNVSNEKPLPKDAKKVIFQNFDSEIYKMFVDLVNIATEQYDASNYPHFDTLGFIRLDDNVLYESIRNKYSFDSARCSYYMELKEPFEQVEGGRSQTQYDVVHVKPRRKPANVDKYNGLSKRYVPGSKAKGKRKKDYSWTKKLPGETDRSYEMFMLQRRHFVLNNVKEFNSYQLFKVEIPGLSPTFVATRMIKRKGKKAQPMNGLYATNFSAPAIINEEIDLKWVVLDRESLRYYAELGVGPRGKNLGKVVKLYKDDDLGMEGHAQVMLVGNVLCIINELPRFGFGLGGKARFFDPAVASLFYPKHNEMPNSRIEFKVVKLEGAKQQTVNSLKAYVVNFRHLAKDEEVILDRYYDIPLSNMILSNYSIDNLKDISLIRTQRILLQDLSTWLLASGPLSTPVPSFHVPEQPLYLVTSPLKFDLSEVREKEEEGIFEKKLVDSRLKEIHGDAKKMKLLKSMLGYEAYEQEVVPVPEKSKKEERRENIQKQLNERMEQSSQVIVNIGNINIGRVGEGGEGEEGNIGEALSRLMNPSSIQAFKGKAKEIKKSKGVDDEILTGILQGKLDFFKEKDIKFQKELEELREQYLESEAYKEEVLNNMKKEVKQANKVVIREGEIAPLVDTLNKFTEKSKELQQRLENLDTNSGVQFNQQVVEEFNDELSKIKKKVEKIDTESEEYEKSYEALISLIGVQKERFTQNEKRIFSQIRKNEEATVQNRQALQVFVTQHAQMRTEMMQTYNSKIAQLEENIMLLKKEMQKQGEINNTVSLFYDEQQEENEAQAAAIMINAQEIDRQGSTIRSLDAALVNQGSAIDRASRDVEEFMENVVDEIDERDDILRDELAVRDNTLRAELDEEVMETLDDLDYRLQRNGGATVRVRRLLYELVQGLQQQYDDSGVIGEKRKRTGEENEGELLELGGPSSLKITKYGGEDDEEFPPSFGMPMLTRIRQSLMPLKDVDLEFKKDEWKQNIQKYIIRILIRAGVLNYNNFAVNAELEIIIVSGQRDVKTFVQATLLKWKLYAETKTFQDDQAVEFANNIFDSVTQRFQIELPDDLEPGILDLYNFPDQVDDDADDRILAIENGSLPMIQNPDGEDSTGEDAPDAPDAEEEEEEFDVTISEV